MAQQVTLKGNKELARAFKALGDAVKGKALETAAMDAGFMMQREIQGIAPVDTGAYRASIRTELEKASTTYAESTVGTNAEQAFALEFGSGLHAEHGPKGKYPIEPDQKQMLAFHWPDAPPWASRLPDGRVVFFRVMHPGIEPQPHFRPGFKAGKPKAVKAAKMALRRTIDRVIARGGKI